jgi:PAS domain S-box-containing protein
MEAKVHDFDFTDEPLDFEHIRALYEQAPDAVVVLEPRSGTVMAANRAMRDLLGYEPHALAGRSVDRLAHPESRRCHADVWKAIACSTGLRDADVELISRDGRKVEASVSTSVVRDQRGAAISRVAVLRDISRRRCFEREMLADHGHLRALASELSAAEERERKRIASGLHDEIGQVLAIAKLKLGELSRLREATADSDVIEDIRGLVDEASRAARTATFDLSCPVLQQLGLAAAIENLGSRMRRTGQVQFSFSSDGGDLPFPAETLAVLYRATRELLFNVDKHAHACTAEVEMFRARNELVIRVRDDGVGFESGGTPVRLSPKGGFGLSSIAAQMRGIGGRLDIDSAPGAGTRVELRLPLQGVVAV